jgi:recombination protein RecR
MKQITPALERLVAELGKLPSVGPKTALRQALYLLEMDREIAIGLAETIKDAMQKIRHCERCYNYSEQELCTICADPARELGTICVVSGIGNLYTIERSGEYRGQYHVLRGSISPLEGRGPSNIRLDELISRLRGSETINEVILATNPNVEGDATAMYIQEQIASLGLPIKVSRIAYGLPVGGDIDYVDDLTLARALSSRREM